MDIFRTGKCDGALIIVAEVHDDSAEFQLVYSWFFSLISGIKKKKTSSILTKSFQREQTVEISKQHSVYHIRGLRSKAQNHSGTKTYPTAI